MSRSRRAGIPRDQARLRPLYARILGLQYLRPSGFLCFVFLEGAVALGVLLALAELVSWWGVVILPLTVALMVKLNDAVAGALSTPPARDGVRIVRPATASAAGQRAPAARRITGTVTGTASRPPQKPVSGGDARVGPLHQGVDLTGLNAYPPAQGRSGQAESSQDWARQRASRRFE